MKTAKVLVLPRVPKAEAPPIKEPRGTVVHDDTITFVQPETLTDMYGNQLPYLSLHVPSPAACKTLRHIMSCSTLLEAKPSLSQPILIEPIHEGDSTGSNLNSWVDIQEIVKTIDQSRLNPGYKSAKCKNYSLAELQQFCKSLNLPSTGNKSVLINRIKTKIYEFEC